MSRKAVFEYLYSSLQARTMQKGLYPYCPGKLLIQFMLLPFVPSVTGIYWAQDQLRRAIHSVECIHSGA